MLGRSLHIFATLLWGAHVPETSQCCSFRSFTRFFHDLSTILCSSLVFSLFLDIFPVEKTCVWSFPADQGNVILPCEMKVLVSHPCIANLLCLFVQLLKYPSTAVACTGDIHSEKPCCAWACCHMILVAPASLSWTRTNLNMSNDMTRRFFAGAFELKHYFALRATTNLGKMSL